MEISLKINRGGKKAVKLESLVNIVSDNVHRSVLCKKRGQLTRFLAENGVLIFKKLKKLSLVKKVFFVLSCEKRIWGQQHSRTLSTQTQACVPLSVTKRWWFVSVTLTLPKICTADSGRIVSFCFLSFRYSTVVIIYKFRLKLFDLVKNADADLVKSKGKTSRITKVSDLVKNDLVRGCYINKVYKVKVLRCLCVKGKCSCKQKKIFNRHSHSGKFYQSCESYLDNYNSESVRHVTAVKVVSISSINSTNIEPVTTESVTFDSVKKSSGNLHLKVYRIFNTPIKIKCEYDLNILWLSCCCW